MTADHPITRAVNHASTASEVPVQSSPRPAHPTNDALRDDPSVQPLIAGRLQARARDHPMRLRPHPYEVALYYDAEQRPYRASSAVSSSRASFRGSRIT